MYDARQIANWFIRRAHRDKRVLSVSSILKLTYISHGQYLAQHGMPLFTNEIQAWKYGPVIVDVYNSFRRQGMEVSVPLRNLPDIEKPSDIGLLEEVWDQYSHRSAAELSRLTHISGGPWDLARKIGGWYAPIPYELIEQHYKQHYDARATHA